jgi:hypothetical protein
VSNSPSPCCTCGGERGTHRATAQGRIVASVRRSAVSARARQLTP